VSRVQADWRSAIFGLAVCSGVAQNEMDRAAEMRKQRQSFFFCALTHGAPTERDLNKTCCYKHCTPTE
jgi:hypothetical protein